MNDITRRKFFGVVGVALASVAAARLPKAKDAQNATFEVAPDGKLTFNEEDFRLGGPLRFSKGALDYIEVKSDSASQDLIFFENSGKCGWGTTAPNTILHVTSNGNVGIGTLGKNTLQED